MSIAARLLERGVNIGLGGFDPVRIDHGCSSRTARDCAWEPKHDVARVMNTKRIAAALRKALGLGRRRKFAQASITLTRSLVGAGPLIIAAGLREIAAGVGTRHRSIPRLLRIWLITRGLLVRSLSDFG